MELISLQAPNLENLKNRNKRSLIEICKKNGLKSSGIKEVLLERLFDYFGYSDEASLRLDGHITIDSEEVVYPPRPDGNLFTIGEENTTLISAVLGLSTPPDPNVFEKFTRMTMDVDSVDCYEAPGVKISKRVCNFCRLKNSCEVKELDFNKNHLIFEIKLKKNTSRRKSLESDKQRLQDYFSKQMYVVDYSYPLIFSSTSDPFKPGFGENSSRKLTLTLVDYISSAPRKKSTWSHLFYSNILNRTLTLFEAMLVSSMNSKTTDVTGTNSFPSIQEITEFFVNSLNINLDSSDSDIRSNLMDIFWSELEVSMQEESKMFMKELISRTRRFYDLGLYDIPTELFMNYDEDVEFNGHIINFLMEIVTSLREASSSQGELFLDKRLDVVIFSNHPNTEISSLLPAYRIIRVVREIQLDQSWVLIDGGIPHVDFRKPMQDKMKKINQRQISKSKQVSILSENVKHSKEFLFRRWDDSLPSGEHDDFGKEPEKRRFVSVFSNDKIFEAYAMHEFLINLKLNHGDKDFSRNQEQFNTFFERMFLFRIDGRHTDDPDFYEKMTQSLYHPGTKNLLPLARLVRLSNEFPNRIEMIEDPDGTDRTRKETTTQFRFTSRYRINNQKETTTICIRRVKILDSRKTYWKLQKSDGREIFGQKKTLKQFFESLNYNPKKVSSSDIPDIGLFLSSGMTLLLDQFATANTTRVFDKLGALLNSYSNEGVLCLCIPSEFDQFCKLLGPIKSREINFDGNSVITWQPPLASRVSSQNVRFTGRSL